MYGIYYYLCYCSIHQERASARARSKEWHTRVTVAAKKIADAEARGLRPPMSELHRRSAERLRELCSVNGGVYVRRARNVPAYCCVLSWGGGFGLADASEHHRERRFTATYIHP